MPSCGAAKAAKKASLAVLKIVPPWASIASRRMASWRASALCIASGWRSQRGVLSSRSVKRKVIVPAGRSAMAGLAGVDPDVGASAGTDMIEITPPP
jgi:hypothetical protein